MNSMDFLLIVFLLMYECSLTLIFEIEIVIGINLRFHLYLKIPISYPLCFSFPYLRRRGIAELLRRLLIEPSSFSRKSLDWMLRGGFLLKRLLIVSPSCFTCNSLDSIIRGGLLLLGRWAETPDEGNDDGDVVDNGGVEEDEEDEPLADRRGYLLWTLLLSFEFLRRLSSWVRISALVAFAPDRLFLRVLYRPLAALKAWRSRFWISASRGGDADTGFCFGSPLRYNGKLLFSQGTRASRWWSSILL